MDVAERLGRAAAVVPASVTSGVGATVADVREYLQHDEWQVALDLLADLDWVADAAWWDLLIEVAESLWLADVAAWCHWRRFESVHGVIRASLTLRPSADGGRRGPVPGKGVLRPLWHIGQHMPDGRPNLLVARIWVEHAPELKPGATGPIRLAPLTPAAWRDLRPSQTIVMHEGQSVQGTATITERWLPADPSD